MSKQKKHENFVTVTYENATDIKDIFLVLMKHLDIDYDWNDYLKDNDIPESMHPVDRLKELCRKAKYEFTITVKY